MKSVVHFINVRLHFKHGYSESSRCQAGRIRLWHGLEPYIQCKLSDESFFPPKWYLKCVPFNTPHCKHRVIRTKFHLNIFIESILWEISIEIDWKFFGPNAQAPIHSDTHNWLEQSGNVHTKKTPWYPYIIHSNGSCLSHMKLGFMFNINSW